MHGIHVLVSIGRVRCERALLQYPFHVSPSITSFSFLDLRACRNGTQSCCCDQKSTRRRKQYKTGPYNLDQPIYYAVNITCT